MKRASFRFVLLALVSAALTWFCAAGVVMNGSFSTVADGAVKRQYVNAAITFEILTALGLLATIFCIVLAWRCR